MNRGDGDELAMIGFDPRASAVLPLMTEYEDLASRDGVAESL